MYYIDDIKPSLVNKWQDEVKKEYAAHERTTPADQSTEMSRHKLKSKKFNEKSPDGDKVLESNKDRTLSQVNYVVG